MKNYMKKGIVSAALAGSMIVALPGAAFAATVNNEGAAISKDWTVASAQQAADGETFNFTVQYQGADAVGSYAPSATYNGAAVTTATSVTKTIALKGGTLSGTVSQKDLFAGFDFATPGKYHFVVTENAGTNANIVYSQASYLVTVNVKSAVDAQGVPTGAGEIDSVVFEQKAADAGEAVEGEKSGSAAFANGAAENASLDVTKKVAGTAANTEDEFNFTVQLEGVTGEYTVILPDGTTATTTNQAWTGKLKHGQTVEIKNLPVGAKYTVSETDTDYTESYVVNNGTSTEGLTTGKQEVSKNGNSVTFTNEKGFIPQTGITANTLPFAAGAVVVVAGAGALAITRKRRASEEF